MRPCLVLLWALLPAIVGAQQKDSASAQRHNATSAYQRGTDSAPVSVKLLNTGKSDTETAQQSRRIQADEDSASRAFWLTIAVVVVSLLQFLALCFTYFIMRDTARRQLRAYMGFSTGSLNEFPRGQSVEFDADGTLINYGQTPAYDLVSVTRLLVRDAQLPSNDDLIPLSDGRPVTGYFAPRQTATMFQPSLTISRTEAQEVRAGVKKRLYYAGILTYRDALDTRWRFRFCYRVNWGRVITFEATTEHNDEKRE